MRHVVKACIYSLIVFCILVHFLKHFILPDYFGSLLTDLFDMPVKMESLFINPVSGEASAENIEFKNPERFSRAPHLSAARLHFQIDLLELLNKRVQMDYVYFENLFYSIERRSDGENYRSNIGHWIAHMKNRNALRRAKRESKGLPHTKTKWVVDIHSIQIQNGTFIYDSRRKYDRLQQYYFDRINAELKGFHWPSPDYKAMNQTLRLTARIGEEYPAPLEIHGRADFATSHVSFDLEGKIPEGDIREFERFWSHLPIRVESGKFTLETRFQSLDKHIESKNTLLLKNHKIRSEGQSLDKLWGVSWVTLTRFLQSKNEIKLDVPVNGELNSPRFEYAQAFTEATRTALREHVSTGVKTFIDAPAVIAAQTKELVSLGVDAGKKLVKPGEQIIERGIESVT